MKKISRSLFLWAFVVAGLNQCVPTAVGQSFLTNGLVAYYPFHGNANDESGLGKNGTVEGATLTTDRFGLLNSAYSFNGIDNRISTVGGSGLPAGMGDFTVSAWAAADQPISGDSRDLVSNGAYNQFSLILGGLGFETNKEIQMYLDHYGPGQQTLFSTNLVWVDKVWYQVTVTRQSGLVTIYRNGVPIAAQQFTTTNPSLPGLSDLTIGGRLDVGKVGHPFKGKIDEVRLYNRALSASEVQQLYQYESSPHPFITDGLVAYFPFNGNASDATGNGHNGLATGATLTTNRWGEANQAYLFNSLAYITAPLGTIVFSNDFTVSVWFNATQIPGGWHKLISVPTPNQQEAVFDVTIPGTACGCGGSGHLIASSSYAPAAHSWFLDRAEQTPLNSFNQVIVTKSGANVKMYVNGQIAITGNVSVPNLQVGDTLWIGRAATDHPTIPGAYGFRGVLDDIRIYNRALSANEVQQLYAFESQPHYPPCTPRTATATPILMNGFVIGATVADGGSCYTNTPTVRIVGGGGAGAQAVAVVSNGVVIAVNVLDAGYGYTGTASVVINPPFIPNPVLGLAPMSFLSFSNLTLGSAYQLQQWAGWYWSNQPVSFTATNSFFNQMVTGVAGNADYRLAPSPVPSQAFATAQVVNGFVVSATVTNGGSGYVTSPAVTIIGGGGTNATAVSQISGGVVTNITITSAGFGYSSTPTIRIEPPPVSALYPTVQPVMRVDSANLAPYCNYQIQSQPSLGGTWGNWAGGLFSPTAVTNSQFLFVTNSTGYFRLQYLP